MPEEKTQWTAYYSLSRHTVKLDPRPCWPLRPLTGALGGIMMGRHSPSSLRTKRRCRTLGSSGRGSTSADRGHPAPRTRVYHLDVRGTGFPRSDKAVRPFHSSILSTLPRQHMFHTRLLLTLMAAAALGSTQSLVVDQRGNLCDARVGELRVCLLRSEFGVRLAGVMAGDFGILRQNDLLWAAELRDTQGRRRLLNSDLGRPRVVADGDHLRVRWEGLRLRGADRVDVEVAVRFQPRQSRTEWRIAFAHIPQGWTLYRYLFPRVSLAAEQGDSCAFVEPHDWGLLTRDPLKRLEQHWRIYPRSSVAMQFYGLVRGDRVVYLACHDPRARTKEFLIDRDPGNTAISFGVSQPTRLRYGAPYKQEYPFVLQVLRGDWYDAAMNYRAWALTAPWTWRGPLHRGKKTPKRYLETPVVLLRLGQEIMEPDFVAD